MIFKCEGNSYKCRFVQIAPEYNRNPSLGYRSRCGINVNPCARDEEERTKRTKIDINKWEGLFSNFFYKFKTIKSFSQDISNENK